MNSRQRISLISTIYLLLKDFCQEPFVICQEQPGQPVSLTVDHKDYIELTHDTDNVYFYYLSSLVFIFNADDCFSLKLGSMEIVSERSHVTLKKL